MRPEPKRCPECGEDFLHTTEVCSDCGVPLKLVSELEGPDAGAGLPPASELALIRAEGPAWIDVLAAALRAADIPSRVEIIDPEQHGARSGLTGSACGLFVREVDVVRAREIDAEVQREQIPDMPTEDVAGEGEEGCPACGHAIAADDAECPDCGLFLG
ncbi:MAG: hypothetical protein JRH10_20380 [Deltaproteobacteria bacterium]|nr:hypothetical protein [Deltaproteobacteria bacterium]MBW2446190.1 hypothetical protein [Deltaproteobacteria bacterium]